MNNFQKLKTILKETAMAMIVLGGFLAYGSLVILILFGMF